MPLYEYECDACGHRFEVIQKFSDAPVETCPKCGGSVHKVQSAPAFQFKGSGWYITDYAKAGSAKPESGDGSKPETKTESKPDATPDSGAAETKSSAATAPSKAAAKSTSD
jgi:putative FmdB family regulatory protein